MKNASTKNKIIETAGKLFAERGFDGVSIRDIVNEAHVNLGAVTYHFGSKEALFGEVIARKIDPMRKIFVDIVSGKKTPEQKLREMFSAYGYYILTEQPELKVLFAEMLAGGRRLPKQAIDGITWRNRAFAQVAQEGIKMGVFRKTDIACAAWSFFGMLCAYMLYEPLMAGGPRSGPYPRVYIKRVVEAALDIFMNGLLAAPRK